MEVEEEEAENKKTLVRATPGHSKRPLLTAFMESFLKYSLNRVRSDADKAQNSLDHSGVVRPPVCPLLETSNPRPHTLHLQILNPLPQLLNPELQTRTPQPKHQTPITNHHPLTPNPKFQKLNRGGVSPRAGWGTPRFCEKLTVL